MSSTEIQAMNATIPAECAGMRLDQALARLFPDYSRSRIQQWIKKGDVKMNSAVPRPRDQVHGGEHVEITPHTDIIDIFQAEALPLELVYEDPHLLVIDKPPGLVVHPAPGNWQGTLLNALLHHAPELKALPRAGIVHRLDKETSGLMVVARTLKAHKHLVDQLQARLIRREYLALVQGKVISGGTVEGNVGRHPVHRKRMAVLEGAGKPAVTHYRVAQRFSHHT
ncbi:MAG: RluA family pseudouridine synthase, partial [Pseudomonadota bacterium]